MKTVLFINKKYTEIQSLQLFLFNKLIDKLKYFNYDYDLIEIEYKSDRYGQLPLPGSYFDFKMKQFYHELEKYDNDEIILYIDHFDIFPLTGPEEVLEKFKSFNTDIVFGHEKNCWPTLNNIDKFYPNKDYINCGIYMGINSKIRKMMDYSFAFDTIQFYDDQHAWSLMTRLINEGIKTKNDVNSTIALCLHGRDISQYNIFENRLINSLDNTKPCFIHGNNNSFKEYIEDKNKNIINGLLNIEPTKTS
jgi:hypothetical protein